MPPLQWELDRLPVEAFFPEAEESQDETEEEKNPPLPTFATQTPPPPPRPQYHAEPTLCSPTLTFFESQSCSQTTRRFPMNSSSSSSSCSSSSYSFSPSSTNYSSSSSSSSNSAVPFPPDRLNYDQRTARFTWLERYQAIGFDVLFDLSSSKDEGIQFPIDVSTGVQTHEKLKEIPGLLVKRFLNPTMKVTILGNDRLRPVILVTEVVKKRSQNDNTKIGSSGGPPQLYLCEPKIVSIVEEPAPPGKRTYNIRFSDRGALGEGLSQKLEYYLAFVFFENGMWEMGEGEGEERKPGIWHARHPLTEKESPKKGDSKERSGRSVPLTMLSGSADRPKHVVISRCGMVRVRRNLGDGEVGGESDVVLSNCDFLRLVFQAKKSKKAELGGTKKRKERGGVKKEEELDSMSEMAGHFKELRNIKAHFSEVGDLDGQRALWKEAGV
eukprot:CAMPEP_0201530594 /NCGR_PEP_ID=MMETSP0161_2-20130828/45118_1 /ASSEMBLY_ACC=CAM_ASM_000251 /TAXON_ID=180227 /ORGANISM="Neoparamoeba aestuarina, Strain SoJaBio B1-5/56/2" /LENGTH=439 /DNA_ID=CAMNT_0047933017 /DNA_START=1 /DNA_END=1316 /DNA_ORIENTATION=-